MNSLKPASCRRFSAAFAPGNIAIWSGSRKYSFSSMMVPSRSKKTARFIKRQTPSAKLHRNSKSQAPITFRHGVFALESAVLRLRFGAWSFFGVWSLGFGTSSPFAFETRQQFLRRHRGRAHFADDSARRVIGKNRRLQGRGPGSNSQGERRNHGVARAGNIKHFASERRNVERLLSALTQE